MSRLLSLRLLIVVLVCAALSLAAPASAEMHKAKDPARDVVTFDENANLVVAPTNTNTDIRRTTVKHTKKRMVITVRLRDLTRLGKQEAAQLLVDIKSSGQLHFAIVTKVGARKPRFDFGRGELQLKCPRTKLRVSAAKDLMKLSMRRACLGNPKAIRVSVGAATSSIEATFIDDALGGPFDGTGRFGFTPKLKRA